MSTRSVCWSVFSYLMAYGCAASSGAAQSRHVGGTVECPVLSDTTSWTEFQAYGIGIGFRAPPRYVRKDWANRSDTTVVQSVYWRDDSPAHRIALTRSTSEVPELPTTPEAKVMECQLSSGMGNVAVAIAEVVRPIPGKEPGIAISLRAVMHGPGPEEWIVFDGLSVDRSGHIEQLAILRSTRLLNRAR